ncbi:hypothetical protein [Paraburkholderia sediminicola]|uniref:hypothetical protein n=1 Tax=Paraburkholderia sediminicola TaxID=458836 RepID=UPI0038B77909
MSDPVAQAAAQIAADAAQSTEPSILSEIVGEFKALGEKVEHLIHPDAPGNAPAVAEGSATGVATTDAPAVAQRGETVVEHAEAAPADTSATTSVETVASESTPAAADLPNVASIVPAGDATVLGVPGAVAGSADYAIRRALQQSPEQAQAASGRDFGGAVHPVGNLFGVTNTPGYQGEATQRAQQAVGGVVGQGVNAVASATGLPQQDVANMAGSLSLAVPGAVKGVVRAVAPAARAAASFVGDAAQDTAASDLERPATAAPAWQQAKATYAAPEGMQSRPMVGGGAASANLNPYPQLTGEDASRGAFPQIKLSKISQNVTPEEQGVRANIANQIMGDNAGSVRTGVITGNEDTLRNEYAAAKTPNQTPATQAIRSQIANEQQALGNYAEQRVNATGASQTIGSNEERGRVINDAIYGGDSSLSSYLSDAKKQIYDTARNTAGDNPITTGHVDALFNDPQFQAGVRLRGNDSALSGAQDLINLARTTGFRDPVSGEMYPAGSVAAWDAVRKSMNSNWSPATAGTIREVNGAIDQDIAATGGQEMYKLGDRIHQVEKTLLDSKGIGSVLGEYDANGVKTGASLESIPSKLNTMPLDQWQHIHDTLDDLSRGQIRGAPEGMPPVPAEVQQASGAALNEMHGALARSVYEAGSDKAGAWNQNSVNKVLNSSVGQKITRNFSPDEVQAFHTLNYGGQIMPGVHSYEGAGNQLARLNKPGFVERYVPHAGASTGAAIGGAIPIPGASWAGAAIGERAGTKISNAAAGRREQTQLQGVTSEMQRNAQLGNQSPGVPLNSLMKKGRP